MLNQLWNDEAGFIISAELVLVATLLVIGLIVGLSEVQHAVVSELNDVGEAIGCLNQSYYFSGFHKRKNNGGGGGGGGIAAYTAGSLKFDHLDDCDGNECDISCLPPTMEGPKGRHR
jgi:Flp pilus assembly pilin Flp